MELISMATLGQQLVAAGVVSAGPGGPGGVPATRADFAIFWSGSPGTTNVFVELPITLAITLPASLSGSQFTARVASTADYVITLSKNGTSIGTVTFHHSTSPTVSFVSDVNFAVGDLLAIIGQGAADATLTDIGLSFKATVT